MPPPLVSIVTPSFNQVKYIEHTVLSVLNQDYPNIEYIIFDGGSTDGSIDVIKKYADKLTYWVSEADKGQSDAINKGWRMAKGDILFYLNSDDLLYDNQVVSKIVAAYKLNPKAAVFYGDCQIIDSKGNNVKFKKAQPCNTNMLLKTNEFASILYQTSSFFNGKYLREINYLQTNLHYCMDYELIVSLSEKGEMVYLPVTVASFRVHGESKSHLGNVPMMNEMLQIKFKHHFWHGIQYLWTYLKFRFFLVLPMKLKKALKPELYERYFS
ncbi:MAG: glycosyltransferase family 2 protein [Bacteroidota bacterium]|nr:glycosyltransferase family 2 protein [Bacteroidota bacterium]